MRNKIQNGFQFKREKQRNQAEKNKLTGVASGVTTVIAIPVSAPFALSDVMSSDMFELLMKIGGK